MTGTQALSSDNKVERQVCKQANSGKERNEQARPIETDGSQEAVHEGRGYLAYTKNTYEGKCHAN